MRRASPSHPTVAAHSSKVSGPHSEKQQRRAGEMAPNLSARFSSDECCDEDDESLNRRSENVAVDAANATCMREDRLKCVLLGDGAVGKTSLVVSYSTNGYPVEYVPTAFDNYSVRVDINGTPTRLQICDTAGQDEFDGMRPLCYSGTDVFLVCFSVVRPISLCNIRDKWMAEVKKYQPKVPILLVGTQTDLRDNLDVLVDLARCNQRPVTAEVGERCAKELGAVAYVECSALTQKNLKEVFDQAIIEASSWRRRREKKRTKRKWRKRDRDSVRCGRAKSMRRKSVAWWRKLFACASL